MTAHPEEAEARARLVERLRAVESGNFPHGSTVTTNWYRNPDGPEAADRIERLEEALREIKRIKPTPIGDTGFQTGPLAHFQQAQRIAKEALQEPQA